MYKQVLTFSGRGSTLVRDCFGVHFLPWFVCHSRSLATSLFVATTYNDWQAKKQKRPRLDRSALEAQALPSLVAKPIITPETSGEPCARMSRVTATAMMGYYKCLKAVCEKQKKRQSRPHPAVRQISATVSVTCPASVELHELSPTECKVNELDSSRRCLHIGVLQLRCS